ATNLRGSVIALPPEHDFRENNRISVEVHGYYVYSKYWATRTAWASAERAKTHLSRERHDWRCYERLYLAGSGERVRMAGVPRLLPYSLATATHPKVAGTALRTTEGVHGLVPDLRQGGADQGRHSGLCQSVWGVGGRTDGRGV